MLAKELVTGNFFYEPDTQSDYEVITVKPGMRKNYVRIVARNIGTNENEVLHLPGNTVYDDTLAKNITKNLDTVDDLFVGATFEDIDGSQYEVTGLNWKITHTFLELRNIVTGEEVIVTYKNSHNIIRLTYPVIAVRETDIMKNDFHRSFERISAHINEELDTVRIYRKTLSKSVGSEEIINNEDDVKIGAIKRENGLVIIAFIMWGSVQIVTGYSLVTALNRMLNRVTLYAEKS